MIDCFFRKKKQHEGVHFIMTVIYKGINRWEISLAQHRRVGAKKIINVSLGVVYTLMNILSSSPL